MGVLLFDLWGQKTTQRQAIFPMKKGGSRGFDALMVDNDSLCGGEAWSLDGAAAPVWYFRQVVYSNLAHMADLAPWFEKIDNIPESFFTHLVASVPREWMAGDELALQALLRRLSTRRNKLRALAFSYLCSNSEFFLSWLPRKRPQERKSARRSNRGVWHNTADRAHVVAPFKRH